MRRRLVWVLACLTLWNPSVFARAQIFHGSYTAPWNGGNTSGGIWAGDLLPAQGTLSNLYVEVGTASGAGKSWTFTVYKNGSSTGLTCAISGASAVQCSDTTNTVTTVDGDTVNILIQPSNSPANTDMVWSAQYDTGVANESIIGSASCDGLSTGGLTYIPPHGYLQYGSNTEGDVELVIPTGGTIGQLFGKMSGAPGTGKSWTIVVRINEADSTSTCVISDAATTCQDVSHTSAVSAGGRVSCSITSTGGPTSGNNGRCGFVFTATTDGEFVIPSSSATALSVSAVRYQYLWAAGIAPNATEANVDAGGQASTMKAIRVYLSAAPGAGKNYIITLRNNVADTADTCTVSDTAQTCNLSSNVTITNHDRS